MLHAHLPFVRHPEYSKFIEEDWLNEAINECYLPLLRMFHKLRDEGVPFRLVFSISPTLNFMLRDPLLKERFLTYLNSRIELGEKEVVRTKNSPLENETARFYLNNAKENLNFYNNTCGTDILSAFNNLSNSGHLELITTTATHAYLPIYKNHPIAVNAQIETGIMSHAHTIDKELRGFWLPECGYYPGLETLLKRHQIEYTSVASHSFFLSRDFIKNGSYMPVKTPSGVHFFARDYRLTSLIWSATEGYPADEDYRDFYRDIGYDLPIEYIKDYIADPSYRVFTGFKYHAITGKTPDKRLYDISRANKKTEIHANNFLYNIISTGRSVEGNLDEDPIYTLSFDAELFGHWWFEGPSWLEKVIRLCAEKEDVRLTTPTEYIRSHSKIQTAQPAFSSWGKRGYSEVWVDNSSNSWLCKYTIKATEWMSELATRFPNQTSLKKRFLSQAARECLLAMASDWPFIMNNHTTEEYAKYRITAHLQNFYLVYDNMCKNAVNTEWLVTSERQNNIFPDLDYNIFNQNYLAHPSPVYTTDFSM